jgi:hypothetical protein
LQRVCHSSHLVADGLHQLKEAVDLQARLFQDVSQGRSLYGPVRWDSYLEKLVADPFLKP